MAQGCLVAAKRLW